MKGLKGLNIAGAVTVVGTVVLWQLANWSEVVDSSSVPPPTDVGRALRGIVTSGELTPALLHTLGVVLAGSAIAIGVAVVLGMALGLSAAVYGWSMASVDFLRTVPVVALLPVAVLLWGPSTKSELIITAYAGTWVMTVNTAGAFRAVHPRLADVGRTFRLSRSQIVRKIWLPAITPALLVGARLCVVTASLTAIIAETLVNPQGLGWALIRAQQSLHPEELWAFALVAGLFGYLLNVLLIQAVRILSPGGRANPALIGA